MSQSIPVIEVQVNEGVVHEESLIKRNFHSLEELKSKVKELRGTIKMGLESDSDYKETDTKIKDLQKAKKTFKIRVIQQESLLNANASLKEINEEIKDVKDSLNGHIDSYRQVTQLSFLDIDGVEVKFVNNYKIKKINKK